jgi:hypothetical protein
MAEQGIALYKVHFCYMKQIRTIVSKCYMTQPPNKTLLDVSLLSKLSFNKQYNKHFILMRFLIPLTFVSSGILNNRLYKHLETIVRICFI